MRKNERKAQVRYIKNNQKTMRQFQFLFEKSDFYSSNNLVKGSPTWCPPARFKISALVMGHFS